MLISTRLFYIVTEAAGKIYIINTNYLINLPYIYKKCLLYFLCIYFTNLNKMVNIVLFKNLVLVVFLLIIIGRPATSNITIDPPGPVVVFDISNSSQHSKQTVLKCISSESYNITWEIPTLNLAELSNQSVIKCCLLN